MLLLVGVGLVAVAVAAGWWIRRSRASARTWRTAQRQREIARATQAATRRIQARYYEAAWTAAEYAIHRQNERSRDRPF